MGLFSIFSGRSKSSDVPSQDNGHSEAHPPDPNQNIKQQIDELLYELEDLTDVQHIKTRAAILSLISKQLADEMIAYQKELLEDYEADVAQQVSEASQFRDLKAERLALKLTQADIAAVIGVSRLTYIKWERNMMLMPIGRYKQICLELDRLAELKQTPPTPNGDEQGGLAKSEEAQSE